MLEKVIKRNGRTVSYKEDKVRTAILKAFSASDRSKEEADVCSKKIALEISNQSDTILSVDEIQNIVEKKLMASTYKDVAKTL